MSIGEVGVSAFKRVEGVRGAYFEFRIQTASTDTWRRFRDFAWLANVLTVVLPGAIFPVLPEKEARTTIAQQSGILVVPSVTEKFLTLRMRALDEYVKTLAQCSNGINEKEAVRKMVMVFLCGSEVEWITFKDTYGQALTSNKRDEKMAAAVAKLRRSESAKEEEEKKKVKTDVIKPSKPPSMFGSFSSKVSSNLQSVGRKLSGSVTAMSQKLRNNETEYREIMATKEEEDDEFRRILLWTKRDLDNIFLALNNTRALISKDNSKVWRGIATSAKRCLDSMDELSESSSSSKSSKLSNDDNSGESVQGEKILSIPGDDNKNDDDGKRTMKLLLEFHADDAAAAREPWEDRRLSCLEPLLTESLVLQAIKNACEVRGKVRNEWGRTVKHHESLKLALQNAYDDPHASALRRMDLEESTDQAEEVRSAALQRLDTASERFKRDFAEYQAARRARLVDFMLVWTKLHISEKTHENMRLTMQLDSLVNACDNQEDAADVSSIAAAEAALLAKDAVEKSAEKQRSSGSFHKGRNSKTMFSGIIFSSHTSAKTKSIVTKSDNEDTKKDERSPSTGEDDDGSSEFSFKEHTPPVEASPATRSSVLARFAKSPETNSSIRVEDKKASSPPTSKTVDSGANSNGSLNVEVEDTADGTESKLSDKPSEIPVKRDEISLEDEGRDTGENMTDSNGKYSALSPAEENSEKGEESRKGKEEVMMEKQSDNPFTVDESIFD